MKHIKGIISVVVMLVVIIIVVENFAELSKTVILKVNLFFWAHESPPMAVYLIIIIAFLIGVFIAGFFGIFERFRLKREIRVLTKQNKGKDKELTSYRNLPIVEDKMVEENLGERDQNNT
jgi:uncharacterized integral membrane protein